MGDTLDASSPCRTIVAAMERAGVEVEGATLTLHILGADVVEVARLRPMCELLFALVRERWAGVENLHLHLSGPQLPPQVAGKEVRVLDDDRVSVRFHPRVYHLLSEEERDMGGPPAMAVCLNAGMWGYETWAPTIRQLASSGVPTLVTSYSIEECEDDEDAIVAALAPAAPRWLWQAEPNPHRSLAPRETSSACEDRERSENLAWLCLA